MRQIIVFLCLVFWSAVSAQSYNVKMQEIPFRAQKFLEEYFATTSFLQLERTEGSFYQVKGINGIVILFNKRGDWVSMHSSVNRWYIPNSVLPLKIRDFLACNFIEDGYKITEVERVGKNYRIQLGNEISLYLTPEAKVIKENG